jgi:hypothetical protein
MASYKTFKVGTWNIGGGRIRSRSEAYDSENLAYFASQLCAADCDVICLQEAHVSQETADNGQVLALAQMLGLNNYWSIPVSESHLARDCCLALGTISKFPLSNLKFFPLRNPKLTAIGPDGTDWRSYDKGFAACTVSVGNTAIRMVTGHSFPFHHFKRDATENEFHDINESIDRMLQLKAGSEYFFAAIDLNYDRPEILLPETFASGMRSAFSGIPTIPKKRQWDHILYSPSLKLLGFRVLEGLADHYLAIAEFQLN